jgi:two-component system alkaline phosphatase synthesis response regulator PhoP
MADILIVEDNESLNDVYKLILTRAGYRVKTAFNGIEALKAVKQRLPDLILLDMLMPEMGGLTFLKKFNPPKSVKTKIIILSNLDEDPNIKEAQKYGATQYILKASLSPSELIAKVSQVLDESKKLDKK